MAGTIDWRKVAKDGVQFAVIHAGYGQPIYATLPSWKAPTTNPARLRIPADGGLQINRGSANAFWINLAYPIN